LTAANMNCIREEDEHMDDIMECSESGDSGSESGEDGWMAELEKSAEPEVDEPKRHSVNLLDQRSQQTSSHRSNPANWDVNKNLMAKPKDRRARGGSVFVMSKPGLREQQQQLEAASAQAAPSGPAGVYMAPGRVRVKSMIEISTNFQARVRQVDALRAGEQSYVVSPKHEMGEEEWGSPCSLPGFGESPSDDSNDGWGGSPCNEWGGSVCNEEMLEDHRAASETCSSSAEPANPMLSMQRRRRHDSMFIANQVS